MKKRIVVLGALLACALAVMGASVIGYQDWQLRGSAPGNPASGFFRVWADNTGQYFKCLTSAGAACYFDPKATVSTPGIVQPDGTSITVTAGVISATGGGGGGGGALVLLGVYNASSSTEIDVVTRNASGQSGAIIQSDYDEYEIHLVALVFSTSLIPGFQMSTNGGSTYDTAANYWWVEGVFQGGQAGSNAATSIQLGDAAISTPSVGNYNGTVRLFNAGSASAYKLMQTETAEWSGGFVRRLLGGAWKSTTASNSFRLIASTGNFASGSLRVYGVAKS